MNTVLLLKFLHVVGFAYWLGTDLGVFYSSSFVANAKLASEVRVTCAKILFALDQSPRICMTLMLPLGVHLAWALGALRVDGFIVVLSWIVCLAWLANVVALHALAPGPGKTILTSMDFWFRAVTAAGLIVAGLAGLNRVGFAVPHWLAWKLVIFGGLVGCGLMVRIRLRPFGPAFANLAAGTPSDADNAAIRQSLARTKPYVIAIWIGLLLSTALGLHLV